MDLRTIYTITVLNAFVALLITLYIHKFLNRYAGSGLWLLSVVLMFFGTLLIALRGKIPDFLSIEIANMAIMACPAVANHSLNTFMRRQTFLKTAYAVAIILFGVFLVAAQTGSLKDRILAASFATGVQWVFPFLTIVLKGRNDAKLRILSLVFFFSSIAAMVRFGFSYFEPDSVDFMIMKGVQPIYSLIMPSLTILIVSAFILIVNNKLVDEIREEKERLKMANAAKDTTFSIISHDLKSSAGTIKQLIDYYMKEADSRDSDPVLNRQLIISAKKQSDHLYNLLDDLLAWGKLMLDNKEPTLKRFKMADVCYSQLGYFSEQIKKKNISVQFDCAEINDLVEADQESITSVLRNLIDNAVKYTPFQGQIQIRIISESNLVKVAVENTGVGFSAENLAALSRGERVVSEKGTLGETGTGFGLLQSLQHALRNHGAISFQNKEDLSGARVVLSMPVAKDQKEIVY